MCTIKSTAARNISGFYSNGDGAIADGRAISRETKFEHWKGVEAGVIALASFHPGYGYLGTGRRDDLIPALRFADQVELARDLHDVDVRLEELRAIADWNSRQGAPSEWRDPILSPDLCVGVISAEGVAELNRETEVVKREGYALTARANALFEEAARRFDSMTIAAPEPK